MRGRLSNVWIQLVHEGSLTILTVDDQVVNTVVLLAGSCAFLTILVR